MVKRRRRRSEESFERRIQKILQSKGYLVINVAMPKFGGHLFDLIAIKDQTGIPIEVKGKKTRYPEHQLKKQIEACRTTGNEFIVIRQSKKKGKISISQPFHLGVIDFLHEATLKEDLKEWLE